MKSELKSTDDLLPQPNDYRPKQRFILKHQSIRRLEEVIDKVNHLAELSSDIKWEFMNTFELSEIITSLITWFIFYRDLTFGLFELLPDKDADIHGFVLKCNDLKAEIVKQQAQLTTVDRELLDSVKEMTELRSQIAKIDENDEQMYNFQVKLNGYGLSSMSERAEHLDFLTNLLEQHTDEAKERKSRVAPKPTSVNLIQQITNHQEELPRPTSNTTTNIIPELLNALKSRTSGRK